MSYGLMKTAYDTDFIIMDKITQPDGDGGIETLWNEGATFKASAIKDESMQARIGEAQGVTAMYTISTSKKVILRFHDVIKRVKDGKVFRILSDGDDKTTPNVSSLDIRQVIAEEWVIPQ